MAPPSSPPPPLAGLGEVAASGPVSCLVALGPTGRLAVATGPSVHLLPGGGAPPLALQTAGGAGKPIHTLAASPDGTSWLAAGERGAKPALWLWKLGDAAGEAAPAEDLARAQHNFGIAGLAWSPSGRLLASHGADKDQQLVVWSPAGGRQLGRARTKGAYDGLAFTGDAQLLGINRESLAVWTLERCASPGGTLKLSCHSYALPASPPPTRMLGLAVLPPPAANARAPPRLVAAADASGRLLKLRVGAPTVDKSADVGEGERVLALAASAEHVAAACASGRVKLFSAATLEEAAVLAAPLRGASAVACVFSGPGGGELTVSYKGGGGAAVASWDLGQAPPALVDVSLRACHSDAITDAVAFTAAGTGERLVATCGLDSQLCIWSCGSGAAALAPASALDLHALLGTSRPRLLCLAVSSDGQLLSCGAGGGFVHVFSLASPAAPTKLATQRVADADVTSLCFDSGSGSSTLAVGCKRGTVRLVRFQHDGSCATLAAPLEDHKAAVTGLALGAARGQAWLCSAGADGRRLTYSWAPPAGAGTVQPQLTGQAAVPRCSWVGLAPAGGDAVVAASKAGRVVCASPAEAGAETSLWALLSRNQGELSCFAVDASLSLLACATSRNQLLLFSLAGSRPAPLAAVKAAHTAGSAISKVLILPSQHCILTVGEDATVRRFALPGTPAAASATPLPAPQAAASTAGASSAISSLLQPRRLSGALAADGASCASPPAGSAEPAAACLTTVLLDAAPVSGEQALPAQRAAAATPSRQSLCNTQRLRGVLGELEERLASLPPARRARTASTPEETLLAAAAAPVPAAASPALSAPPTSPALLWADSPLDALSAISLGALRSPALPSSPDVFADLPSPAVPAGGASAGPTALSPGAPPASVGGSSKGAKLARLASTARNAFVRRSWGWQQASPGGKGDALDVSAALDEADAARVRALMGSMDGEAGDEAAAGTAKPTAIAPASSPTVDIAAAAGPTCAGSASVNQPRRRSWGPVPGSEPRRSASEAGSNDAALEQRSHSSMGIAGDSFSVCAGSAAASGSPASAITSRRLSFCFGTAAGRRASASDSQDEDTPTMPAKPGAAPASAAAPSFALPADYCSPGLPQLAAQQSDSEKESTPRLFLGPKRAAGAAVKSSLQPCAAAATGSAAPPPALAKPHSQRCRPTVPRLNLAAAGIHLASGAAASFALPPVPAAAGPAGVPRGGTFSFAQRRTACPAESSGSTGSRGGCAEDEGQAAESAPPAAATAAAEPTSEAASASTGILPPPGFSPPRLVLSCQLYEHTAAKPAAEAAASRRSSLSSSAAGTSSSYGASQLNGSALSSGAAGSEWGRPACYDPIAEELERWRELASAPEAAACAAAPPSASPASPASDSGASSGGAHSMPAPTAEAALEHLRQGLRALKAAGGASALDAGAAAALAALLEEITGAAGLAAPSSPAPTVLAALAPANAANARPAPASKAAAAKQEDAGRENCVVAAGNSGADAGAGTPSCGAGFIRPADLAALKAELLADLRASLLAELRGSAH